MKLESFPQYTPFKYRESRQIVKEKTLPDFNTKYIDTDKSHNMIKNTLLRCRYELKYYITEAKAQKIRKFIEPYLQLDRYCRTRPNGAYPLVSLYLDSRDLQLCRESLEGKAHRFKLRIRSYTDDPEYPRFFEIKRRLNTIIVKSQTPVLHSDVVPLLLKSALPVQTYDTDEEALGQFLLYMNNINAKPITRIRYIRQAHENNTTQRVRITFDRHICYNVSTSPDVSLNGGGWQYNSLSLNGVVLEIKFTERYPSWLNRMVEYFDLRQQSISKYGTSIQQACLLGFCAPQLSVDNYG